jgi:hypothetical protein
LFERTPFSFIDCRYANAKTAFTKLAETKPSFARDTFVQPHASYMLAKVSLACAERKKIR